MKSTEEIHFWVDREQFFEIGRVLKKGWHRSDLGPVSLAVRGGKLSVMSKRGGGEMPCLGQGEVSAELSAREFCGLITAGLRSKSQNSPLGLTFRPLFGEVAIDVAGAKARFL